MFKRLPNGFGSISKLSGNRRRPYMVRLSDKTIVGYAESYEDAYLLLCKYNKNPWDLELAHATFQDVWDIYRDGDFKRLAKGTQKNLTSRWNKYVSKLADKQYASFKTYHFKKFLDSLDCSSNMKNQVIALLKHLDDTAYQLDIIDKKYAYELKTSTFTRQSNRRPFTEEEIEKLWEHKDEEFVDNILILIYTGFRAQEYLNIKLTDIDTEEWTITGGLKTKAGKNRIVPIHPRIRPLITRAMERSENGRLCKYKHIKYFEKKFYEALERLGIERHVPHECRHTLRSRLDTAGANKVAIDKILGHKSGETGEDVYTHKNTAELHKNIALIS